MIPYLAVYLADHCNLDWKRSKRKIQEWTSIG
jgi:hypothetical protein